MFHLKIKLSKDNFCLLKDQSFNIGNIDSASSVCVDCTGQVRKNAGSLILITYDMTTQPKTDVYGFQVRSSLFIFRTKHFRKED